jgi:hypothetical protein
VYEHNGKEIRYIIHADGTYEAWVDGTYNPNIAGDITGYLTDLDNLSLKTIGHRTWVADSGREVEMLPNTDENTIERVSHINVTEALNYSETVVVNIIKSDGSKHTVSYTVPDVTGADLSAGDQARATNTVALNLANLINAGGTHSYNIPNPAYTGDPAICCEYDVGGVNPGYDPMNTVCQPYLSTFPGVPGVTAIALGSNVAVWQDDGEWLDVEIEAGQGDRAVKAFNQRNEDITGLPLYAVVGTRITVRPDPFTEKGTYYLQAFQTSDTSDGIAPTPGDRHLEEVIWVESRAPDEPFAFDQQTMPFQLVYNEEVDTFGCSIGFWDDRLVGDNESNPPPAFVGQGIDDIEFFQNRLIFVANGIAHLTRTDELDEWWKESALTLLVSDRVSVASSAIKTTNISHALPHNRDMLFVASNGQFKLEGAAAVTPQTVALSLTTRNEVQVLTSPVLMGNSVFMPISYGDSSGLIEYNGESNVARDQSTAITTHIVGLLPGEINQLTASANLSMIAVRTTECADNEFFIYEQFRTREGKVIQRAWSTWTLSLNENARIMDMVFRDDRLDIITLDSDLAQVTLLTVNLYSRS